MPIMCGNRAVRQIVRVFLYILDDHSLTRSQRPATSGGFIDIDAGKVFEKGRGESVLRYDLEHATPVSGSHN